MGVLSEYWEYVGMFIVGVVAIISWLLAWDSRVPMRIRWHFLWLGVALLAFILFITAVDVRFN